MTTPVTEKYQIAEEQPTKKRKRREIETMGNVFTRLECIKRFRMNDIVNDFS